MSFLAPWGFLAALALPVIVALWMLKLRRRRQTVSSTLLWQQAIVNETANAPIQKLRWNLLLFLQIIAATLLALSLARPVIQGTLGTQQPLILLIDQSASMGSTDQPGYSHRLSAAVAAAKTFLSGLSGDRQAAVLSFSTMASVVQPFTNDQGLLFNALDQLQVQDLPARIDEALALASSLATPLNAKIILLSDGAFLPPTVTLPSEQQVDYIQFGTRGENSAITALDVRPINTAGSEPRHEVFLNIAHHSDKPTSGLLEVFADSRLVDVRRIELVPQQSHPQIFQQTIGTATELEFHLSVDADDLPTDNRAYVVLAPPQERKVVLVSQGNYFLERALRSLPGQSIQLQRIAPSAWANRLAENYDLVIFENYAPASPLLPGQYLFINSVPPLAGFSSPGNLTEPRILDWVTDHPLLRFVEFEDVTLRRALALDIPDTALRLVESPGGPLVVAYTSNQIHLVCWGFDLFESNLPLRMAFPLLTANSVQWLLQRGLPQQAAVRQTGEPLRVEIPLNTRRAVLTTPQGTRFEIPPDSSRVATFDRTFSQGFYRTEFDGQPGPVFGLSLLDEKESQTTPRPEFPMATGAITNTPVGQLSRSHREIWPWIVSALIALLLFEWLIYHRRLFLS